MDVAAGRLRLLLQFHEQIHDLTRFAASIHHVAGLYQMGLAASPIIFVIDDFGRPQNLEKLIVIAVNITGGYDAIQAGPNGFRTWTRIYRGSFGGRCSRCKFGRRACHGGRSRGVALLPRPR